MDIKNECDKAVDKMTDTLLFYFYEYPENRKEWAKEFKTAFCKLVDEIEKEFDEEY